MRSGDSRRGGRTGTVCQRAWHRYGSVSPAKGYVWKLFARAQVYLSGNFDDSILQYNPGWRCYRRAESDVDLPAGPTLSRCSDRGIGLRKHGGSD